MDHSSFNFGRV